MSIGAGNIARLERYPEEGSNATKLNVAQANAITRISLLEFSVTGYRRTANAPLIAMRHRVIIALVSCGRSR